MDRETFEFQGTTITIYTKCQRKDDCYEFAAERKTARPVLEPIILRYSDRERRCLNDLTELFDAASLPVEMEYLLQHEGMRLNEVLEREVMRHNDPAYQHLPQD